MTDTNKDEQIKVAYAKAREAVVALEHLKKEDPIEYIKRVAAIRPADYYPENDFFVAISRSAIAGKLGQEEITFEEAQKKEALAEIVKCAKVDTTYEKEALVFLLGAGYFSVLADIGSRAALEAVCDKAKEQFEKKYYDTRGASISALERFAERGEFKDEAIKILLEGLTISNEVISGSLKGNHVAISTILVALGKIGDISVAGEVEREFGVVGDPDAFYELNQVVGQCSLALSALGCTHAVPMMEQWLSESPWDDTKFIFQLRYALWVLKKDADGAMAFLKDTKNEAGLGFAAAALADMGATQAIPVLEETAKAITNVPTKLAFEEAITRLHSGKMPSSRDLMVWMLGALHPAVIARGEEGDDVFIKRAQEQEIVQEVDDSMTKER